MRAESTAQGEENLPNRSTFSKLLHNNTKYPGTIMKDSPCGGGLECPHRSPANSRRRRKGNPVPGGINGHPVTGGHKYRDLVLQVGGWTQGWRPCSAKKNIVAKSGEVQTRWSNSRIDKTGRSSKEGCGSKRAVSPMMTTMMMKSGAVCDVIFETVLFKSLHNVFGFTAN
jgi:hypothetical protein